jgi:predicted NodU family carbamoyl transferase
MLILGLHGWNKREYDPSACLIKDGKILAMAEEERFINCTLCHFCALGAGGF